MQKDYFFNGGGAPPSPPPPPLPFDWNSSWGRSQDQYTQFGSGVSGAGAAVSSGYAVRELIGNICGAPPPFAANMSAQYAENNYNNANNYNTDPSLRVPILGNSPLPLNHPPLSGGGAGEIAAAKLSCLGNRSFNSRTGQFGLKNGDLPCRSNALHCIGDPKLPRVSSTPSLKQAGSPVQNNNSNPTRPESGPTKNSDEEFPVPDQLPTGPKSQTDSNPRKRKPLSRKNEDDGKGSEFDDQTTSKRPKSVEATGSDNNDVKTEDELINTANNTINNANNAGDIKPPEPPKDYIHVRARRGQATDSHSLAERVRREKISERMKLLQDLVPGCSKVTGKALMLDEIINYVQSLQRQVEFLSMKLATVNPRLDLNIDNLLTKDICQSNVSLPHTMYPLDSSAPPAFHGQEPYPPDQIPQLHANLVNAMYPSDTSPSHDLGLKFPPVDGFDENLAQFPSVFEDDLQSIVHMGFNRVSSKDTI